MPKKDLGSALTEEATSPVLPVLHVDGDWTHLLQHVGLPNAASPRLTALFPAYLRRQRWFGARDQAIRRVDVQDTVWLQDSPSSTCVTILNVDLADRTECYLLPLTMACGPDAERLLSTHPHAGLAWIETPDDAPAGLLHDATATPAFWHTLFQWWQSTEAPSVPDVLSATLLGAPIPPVSIAQTRIFWGEQSNSLAFFADRFCLKLYRRLEQGINPETELLEHLTQAGFAFIPKLYGTLSLRRDGRRYVLGILQEALPRGIDGWSYALDMTHRFLERIAGSSLPDDASASDDVPAWLRTTAPEMLALARVLGTRTAELHLALAAAEHPDLRPEPATPDDTHAFLTRLNDELRQTRRMLADHLSSLHNVPDDDAWQHAADRIGRLDRTIAPRRTIRVHGDYHLGQVIFADEEIYLLDFEGEPARSIVERRARDSNLRDVAGMLRSLEYAVLSAWQDYRTQHPDRDDALRSDGATTLVQWCERLFMNTYLATAATPDLTLPAEARRHYLWAYLLQKALYEVRYELSYRPAWTWLPLRGLKRLLSPDAPASL